MNIFYWIIGIWSLIGVCTAIETADNTTDFCMGIKKVHKKILFSILVIFLFGPLVWGIVIVMLAILAIVFVLSKIFGPPTKVIVAWQDKLKNWFIS